MVALHVPLSSAAQGTNPEHLHNMEQAAEVRRWTTLHGHAGASAASKPSQSTEPAPTPSLQLSLHGLPATQAPFAASMNVPPGLASRSAPVPSASLPVSQAHVSRDPQSAGPSPMVDISTETLVPMPSADNSPLANILPPQLPSKPQRKSPPMPTFPADDAGFPPFPPYPPAPPRKRLYPPPRAPEAPVANTTQILVAGAGQTSRLKITLIGLTVSGSVLFGEHM